MKFSGDSTNPKTKPNIEYKNNNCVAFQLAFPPRLFSPGDHLEAVRPHARALHRSRSAMSRTQPITPGAFDQFVNYAAVKTLFAKPEPLPSYSSCLATCFPTQA